jgi:hypothetical protein
MPFEEEASDAKNGSWAGKLNVLLGVALTCVCHGRSRAATVFGIRSTTTSVILTMSVFLLRLCMPASR